MTTRETMLESERKKLDPLFDRIASLQRIGAYPTGFEMPLSVQFELTSRCNLRCRHCYNRSGQEGLPSDGSSPGTAASELIPSEWIALSRDLIKLGGLFDLCLSGGEPLLLGDDLFRILDLFGADETPVKLVTNGFLLDEACCERFAAYPLLQVRLSLDGTDAATHDLLRGVPGSHARAVQAAKLMRKRGVRFHIASTVTPRSLSGMEKMAALAAFLGADYLILDMVLASGRALDNPDLFLDESQLEELLTAIARARFKVDIPIVHSTGYGAVAYFLSGLPAKDVLIRPNGDVRLSCLAPFVIGNVREEPFPVIWRKKARTAWNHPAVIEYLRGIDLLTGISGKVRNYGDPDVRI